MSTPAGGPAPVRIGHLLVPADDLDAVAAFYVDRLGLRLRFRDGDRYAAVTDGTATLGLAGPGEQPDPGRIVVSFQVSGLDELVATWRRDGVAVGEVETGAHERRAVVRDPAGNALVVYEPLP